MLKTIRGTWKRTTRWLPPGNCPPRRHASLTGAIHRGAFKARDRSERIGRHARGGQAAHEQGHQRRDAENSKSRDRAPSGQLYPHRNDRTEQRQDATSGKPPTAHPSDNQHPPPRRSTIPLSIPRTSAASEFLYGFAAVKAAIQAKRRRLYKLYIGDVSDEAVPREGRDELLRWARNLHMRIQTVHGEDIRLLHKMAQGRPHNGLVLEASQLPIWPVEALENVSNPGSGFWFTAGHQSAEELAITGESNKISKSSHRYPLVLLLDNILDPGNLGAIIRSAVFFGVDAVALIDHNLAPFSPVALKASSGAAEFMPYFRVKRDVDFLQRSKRNGWKVFAAIAPGSRSEGNGRLRSTSMDDAASALSEGPCILLIGGEGAGLRPRLQKAADGMIGIKAAPTLRPEIGLDSLNASVAAALMIQTLVSRHNEPRDSNTASSTLEDLESKDRVF